MITLKKKTLKGIFMTNPSKAIKSNMNIGNLRRILSGIVIEMGYKAEELEVWISSDEEGNEFLPMPFKEEHSIGLDIENNRIIFFPVHRQFF